jgi:hypothetical protein
MLVKRLISFLDHADEKYSESHSKGFRECSGLGQLPK